MCKSVGLLAMTLGLVTMSAGAGCAQGVNLPWGQSSDMVAWEVFVQIASPAGIPGSRNVTFETWASDQEIYVPPPQQPRWPAPGEPKKLQRSLSGAFVASGQQPSPLIIGPNDCFVPKNAKAGNFPDPPACIGEEVRRNWSSFLYIVTNNLYTQKGLAAAYAMGLKVDLPSSAIEVKAEWVPVANLVDWINNTIRPTPPLTPALVRQLYHTNSVYNGISNVEFALVSLGFSSKQIKDWVWATFEHQLSPGRCDDIGCRDAFGAAIANVAPKNPPNQYYGTCEKSAATKAMFESAGLSSVWQNYCLKGSQVTFTAGSAPTLLGDSVTERINADIPIPTSSCITCHSYAAFTNQGEAFTDMLRTKPTGPFDPSKLMGARQNDFLWGILTIP
jgi:hypothetical protein